MEHRWNETDREKPVPVPLCPPQIPHGPGIEPGMISTYSRNDTFFFTVGFYHRIRKELKQLNYYGGLAIIFVVLQLACKKCRRIMYFVCSLLRATLWHSRKCRTAPSHILQQVQRLLSACLQTDTTSRLEQHERITERILQLRTACVNENQS
jgi:hypothetical protein